MVLTEFNNGSSGESAAVLYKAGSRVDGPAKGGDVEKGPMPMHTSVRVSFPEGGEKSPNFVKKAPIKGNVFSWQRLCYTVPVSGGNYRRLLDEVSGFVAPGKLTALMGESGAGKVRVVIRASHTRQIQLTNRVTVADRPRC